MRRQLEANGARLAAMSGSGSSVFGLFPTRAAAASAVRSLASRPRWSPILTRVLDRPNYLKRAAVQSLRRLPRSVLIG
jgi:4-diphosphocytidyl-2C-methyl-D-erythritol kinase